MVDNINLLSMSISERVSSLDTLFMLQTTKFYKSYLKTQTKTRKLLLKTQQICDMIKYKIKGGGR